ncbi:MAG: hypothetical protein ABEI57_08200 [Halapricum sp.]
MASTDDETAAETTATETETAEEDHDDHGHETERPDYDPANVELPSREPPLRSTAPQSDFTMRQVAIGFVVLVVGLVVTFGLPLALV